MTNKQAKITLEAQLNKLCVQNPEYQFGIRRFAATWGGDWPTWIEMYIGLRLCGDSHTVAYDTITGEYLHQR